MAIDNRRDILLLLLYSPGLSDEPNAPIQGRTRLVKMLFLFQEEAMDEFRRGTELSDEDFYKFFPWNFGPFSAQVYDDLKFFELRGFIDRSSSTEETTPESAAEWALWLTSSGVDDRTDSFSEYEEEQFRLTDKGVSFVESKLLPDLSSAQKRLLTKFRRRIESAPLRAILKYVYERYPSQTEQSHIKDQVIG